MWVQRGESEAKDFISMAFQSPDTSFCDYVYDVDQGIRTCDGNKWMTGEGMIGPSKRVESIIFKTHVQYYSPGLVSLALAYH